MGCPYLGLIQAWWLQDTAPGMPVTRGPGVEEQGLCGSPAGAQQRESAALGSGSDTKASGRQLPDAVSQCAQLFHITIPGYAPSRSF